jgi:hypothetical protein
MHGDLTASASDSARKRTGMASVCRPLRRLHLASQPSITSSALPHQERRGNLSRCHDGNSQALAGLVVMVSRLGRSQSWRGKWRLAALRTPLQTAPQTSLRFPFRRMLGLGPEFAQDDGVPVRASGRPDMDRVLEPCRVPRSLRRPVARSGYPRSERRLAGVPGRGQVMAGRSLRARRRFAT